MSKELDMSAMENCVCFNLRRVTRKVTQFFDAVTIQGLREEYCCDPYWEGDISYDRDTGEPQGLVRMAGGPLRLWCYLDGAGKPVPGPYRFSRHVQRAQQNRPLRGKIDGFEALVSILICRTS